MTDGNHLVTIVLSPTPTGTIEPLLALTPATSDRTFQRRRLSVIAVGIILSLGIAPILASDGSGPGLSVAAAGADSAVVSEQAMSEPMNIAGLVDDATALVDATTTSSTDAPTTTAAPATTAAPTTTATAAVRAEASTTVAPVTAAPTTATPVTAAPTSAAPTTAAPTTVAPTTTAAPAASAESSSGDYAYSDPRGTQVWYDMAQCEAGGNWSINSGNGYYGGLQFSLGSWQGVGGEGYPHEASRATQIEMGRRLQANQGWGAWPHCSSKLGLR